MHCPIKTFALTVALGPVRCSLCLLYVVHTTQFSNHSTLKVSALITVNSSWYAKVNKPVIHQCCGNCLCFLVFRWNRLCEFCEYIRDYEYILASIRCRLQNCKVNCQNVQWCRCYEATHVCLQLWLLVFSHVATFALVTPSLYIRRHSWPVAAHFH